MTLKHNYCKTVYDIEANHFLRNQRCPNKECNSKKQSIAYMKPIDQLKNELFSCIGNEYLIIGDYKGTNRNTIFYHTVCKNTFLKTPHNFFCWSKMSPLCYTNYW